MADKRPLSCGECGDTAPSRFELEAHVVNEHTDLTFYGQFIYARDEESLRKYCEVRCFEGGHYWTGPGWYGRDHYQNCQGEWVTQVLPILSLREGLVCEVKNAQRQIELIDELPPVPPG